MYAKEFKSPTYSKKLMKSSSSPSAISFKYKNPKHKINQPENHNNVIFRFGQIRNKYSCVNSPIKMLSPEESANISRDKMEDTNRNGAQTERTHSELLEFEIKRRSTILRALDMKSFKSKSQTQIQQSRSLVEIPDTNDGKPQPQEGAVKVFNDDFKEMLYKTMKKERQIDKIKEKYKVKNIKRRRKDGLKEAAESFGLLSFFVRSK